jgi:hypothetical protein
MAALFGKGRNEKSRRGTGALLDEVTRGSPVTDGWRFSLKGSPRFYDDVLRIIESDSGAEVYFGEALTYEGGPGADRTRPLHVLSLHSAGAEVPRAGSARARSRGRRGVHQTDSPQELERRRPLVSSRAHEESRRLPQCDVQNARFVSSRNLQLV